VHDYAATLNDKEQGLSAEAIAKAGMADMSKKFIDMGAEVYVDKDTAVKESNKAL
jgi:phosphomethylpyrimidine synthase